jgi:hypothetical protein
MEKEIRAPDICFVINHQSMRDARLDFRFNIPEKPQTYLQNQLSLLKLHAPHFSITC